MKSIGSTNNNNSSNLMTTTDGDNNISANFRTTEVLDGRFSSLEPL
jgi:hypothetical protein